MTDTIEVEAEDPTKKTSEIINPSSDEITVKVTEMEQNCIWNDIEYDQGVNIISEGKTYKCSFGKWIVY